MSSAAPEPDYRAACLLCGGEVSEPEDLAPDKKWWPLMVRCLNAECIASGVHVVADPDTVEQVAQAYPDATEPKFAYSATDRWFVSTIYRRSTAMNYDRWYYETHAYLTTVGDNRRWLYDASASSPRQALRAHALLAKRASRQFGSAVAA